MADLEYAVANHIATIRLNRPEKKNSFTLEMVDQWAEALLRAEVDDDVRVVVLTGSGDSFCTGVDLGVLDDRERTPLSEKNLLAKRVHHVAHAAEALSKPYLAAINGFAIGAGMDMALMADIRFAGSSARLSEGYIRAGLVPGDGGCFYLPRITGTASALRLLWTGEFIDALGALELGIVSEVCADSELDHRVSTFAHTLASQPPVAVQMIKRAVYSGARTDLRTALDLISSHFAVVTSTADAQEAMAAFKERRQGTFVGK
ncbi:enoyl-CoA hydratase-related protein [Nocardioides endophyticus]|uniref:Enoyl-CoA hydratase-related protein n=1 Tax=Nocardioides endophyticus TaxID=1353775 RepID=A0ABP8YK50_9ACTN